MLFNYASSDDGVSRYGWTVPRAAGRAVDRNRFKRWIREFFQECLGEKHQAHEMQVALFAPKGVSLRALNRDQFREALRAGFERSLKGLKGASNNVEKAR